MRVLQIIKKLEMGGIENMLLLSLPHLKKQGVEIDVLCIKGGFLDNEFINEGAKIIDFDKMDGPFMDAIKLWQVLGSKKYDVVHSCYGHTSGLFAFVCKLKSIPFLVSVHNEKAMFRNSWQGKPVLSFLRNTYLNFHKRLTQKYATKIVGHSKTNLRYFTGDYTKSDQYTVLYNGIDFSKLDSNKPLADQKQATLNKFVGNNSFNIISVGKFKEQKNHAFLIDAFASIQPIENNYKLILVGTGVLQPSIAQKVNELGLSENVLFTGVEQNIAPYLSVSDLFFFPSLYEGFGNVIIEAQYKHLPVLVSDIPPHYESTYSYFQKFFFSPVDAIECKKKLSEIINEINTPGKLDAVQQAAFNFAKEFSIEAMADNVTQIYKEVTLNNNKIIVNN